jgi:hypothetical protein
MVILILCAVLCMEVCREFIVLFCSDCTVKCTFGYTGLKCVRMTCMFRVVGIKDEKDIISMMEIVFGHTLFCLLRDV